MSGPDASNPPQASSQQRLDKWLWYARVTKSRTSAASLIEGGKIRVNRAKADKASQLVRPGDVITATVHRTVRILKVVAAGTRRGPATEARTLYEELTPGPIEAANPAVESKPGSGSPETTQGNRVPGSGRPTKRERRLLDKLRNAGS